MKSDWEHRSRLNPESAAAFVAVATPVVSGMNGPSETRRKCTTLHTRGLSAGGYFRFIGRIWLPNRTKLEFAQVKRYSAGIYRQSRASTPRIAIKTGQTLVYAVVSPFGLWIALQ